MTPEARDKLGEIAGLSLARSIIVLVMGSSLVLAMLILP
jgi:hypothetical protein